MLFVILDVNVYVKLRLGKKREKSCDRVREMEVEMRREGRKKER